MRRLAAGAGRARVQGVGHYIRNQPARVAGLERFEVSHEQADAGVGGQERPQVTDAVGGCEAAIRAAPAARAPACEEGLGAAGEACGAEAGNGMGS